MSSYTRTHAHTHTHPVRGAQVVGSIPAVLLFFNSPCSWGSQQASVLFFFFFRTLCHFFSFLLVGAGVVPPIFTVYKLHTCSGAAVCWRNGVGSKPSRETNAEEKEEEGWRWRSERPMQSATSLAHQGPSTCHGQQDHVAISPFIRQWSLNTSGIRAMA